MCLIFGLCILFLLGVFLNKILTPGMLFQLDSRLRYEQLRQSIEQTYDQGYINKKEKTLLLNRLSANSITQILIRRKLNNMVKRSEKHESSDKNNQRYLMSKEGHINEISKGESEHVEFKESFFFDVNRASKDVDYQKKPTPNDKMFDSSIGKNIAAFLNTRDGRIYVGVSDDGKIVGLERDFQLMQKIKTKNVPVDSLKLRFSERMKKIIPEWGAVHNLVELLFIEGFNPSKDIVVIFVQKSDDTPVEIIIEGKRIFATRTTSGVFTDYSLDTQRKYIAANFKK